MAEISDKSRAGVDLVQFKLRMREELRAKIEIAAQNSGESMNSEIVHRLSASLEEDDRAFGIHTRQLLQRLAIEISRVEGHTGRAWKEDRVTALVVAGAVARVIEQHGPEMLNAGGAVVAFKEVERVLRKQDGLIDSLLDYGALRPLTEGERQAFAELDEVPNALSRPTQPTEELQLYKTFLSAQITLARKGFAAAVDLDKPSSQWALTDRNGAEVDEHYRVGVHAIFATLNDTGAEARAAWQEWRLAHAEDEIAQSEAKEIVEVLHGPPYRIPAELLRQSLAQATA